MFINEKHIVKLYQFELIAFAFLLPIYRKVIPYVIATLVITWILEADFVRKARRLVQSSHRLNTLLFAGLYVLYLFGLINTRNFEYGLFDMEVKMSLFIFPVVFATIRDEVLSPGIARKVFLSFVIGVSAAMVLSYSVALTKFMNTGAVESFYYVNLAVLIHPSYLAMYACFAISILLYYNLNAWIRKPWLKLLSFVLILFFELFIIMLSSKAGILGLVLTIAIFISYILIIEKRIIKAIVVGGVLTASFLILFLLFPTSSDRFAQSREALDQTDVRADEITGSTGERIMIWWYSFEITNNNFFTGVGTGDVKDHLLDKYEEKGMNHARQLQLNAHNQYLQTMIAVGILGLIILLLNLVLPALYSHELKHYLYLIFLLLISFNFLFESMLETQAGVVFYAFFNAYLFAIKKDPASEEAGS
ncbi:MAG: O-antigen ligase family protein [Bacteroidota bacterium]